MAKRQRTLKAFGVIQSSIEIGVSHPRAALQHNRSGLAGCEIREDVLLAEMLAIHAVEDYSVLFDTEQAFLDSPGRVPARLRGLEGDVLKVLYHDAA